MKEKKVPWKVRLKKYLKLQNFYLLLVLIAIYVIAMVATHFSPTNFKSTAEEITIVTALFLAFIFCILIFGGFRKTHRGYNINYREDFFRYKKKHPEDSPKNSSKEKNSALDFLKAYQNAEEKVEKNQTIKAKKSLQIDFKAVVLLFTLMLLIIEIVSAIIHFG